MKTAVAGGKKEEEENKSRVEKMKEGGGTVDPPRRGPLNLQSIFSCADPISMPVRAI